MPLPIIVIPMPVETHRDCIVVEGQTYCRDYGDPSMSQFLVMLTLGLAVCAVWVLPFCYRLIDKENPIKAFAWVFGLPLCGAAIAWMIGP